MIVSLTVFRFWSMSKWATRPPFTIFLMFQTHLWHLHIEAQWVFGLCQQFKHSLSSLSLCQDKVSGWNSKSVETKKQTWVLRNAADVTGAGLSLGSVRRQWGRAGTTDKQNNHDNNASKIQYSFVYSTDSEKYKTRRGTGRHRVTESSLIRSFNKYWPLIKITSNQTSFNRKLQLKKWTLWFFIYILCVKNGFIHSKTLILVWNHVDIYSVSFTAVLV